MILGIAIWLASFVAACLICLSIAVTTRKAVRNSDKPVDGPEVKSPGPTVCRPNWGNHE